MVPSDVVEQILQNVCILDYQKYGRISIRNTLHRSQTKQ